MESESAGNPNRHICSPEFWSANEKRPLPLVFTLTLTEAAEWFDFVAQSFNMAQVKAGSMDSE